MILATSFFEDLFRGLLQGTPPGAVYALTALGFVLTYKTSGVFNLAFGAQAYISAAMYFKAHTLWGWPKWAALALSVFVLAPLVGLILEWLIFRHLRTRPAVSKLVVAIGLSVALPELFNQAARFTAVAGRQITGIMPDGANVFYDAFGVYRFNRDELAMMAVALAGTLLLGALFRFTMLGLAMRAVVESPRMTELSGINADRVSAFAWALSSTFAGMGGVLIAPRFNSLSSSDFFTLVVIAVAAAAMGKLVSLPRALAGGLCLGWFIAEFNTFLPGWSDDHAWLRPIQENLTPALPFVVLFGILVLWRAIGREREATDPLAGVDPPPPALAAHERHPGLTRFTRLFGVFFATVVGLVVWFRADVFWMHLVTTAVIMSVIYLSVTVITGMAGQISLCQGAFGAIGGFMVFQMADRFDMSVLVAALLGAAAAAAVGAVLSLPVLRLGGVWLAIATLAFAFFFDAVVVKFSWVGGGSTALLTGTRVPRPLLGPIDFASDRAFLVLAVIVLAAVSVVVIQLREGTLGRTLAALRGSEVAAALHRHLGRPGPDRGLHGVGGHRRSGGRAVVDAPAQRELRLQLRAGQRPVLAGDRGGSGCPHRGGGPPGGHGLRAVRAPDLAGRAAGLDPAGRGPPARPVSHTWQLADSAVRPDDHPVRSPSRRPPGARQATLRGTDQPLAGGSFGSGVVSAVRAAWGVVNRWLAARSGAVS